MAECTITHRAGDFNRLVSLVSYDCPFCATVLNDQDTRKFLSWDAAGNPMTVYVFYCRRCEEQFHWHSGKVDRV